MKYKCQVCAAEIKVNLEGKFVKPCKHKDAPIVVEMTAECHGAAGIGA